MDTIAKAKDILDKPLDVENLVGNLVEAEACMRRVSTELVKAREVLNKARNRYLMPKTSGLNELDRTIQLEAAVAPEQRAFDELDQLFTLLLRRVELGQAILTNAHYA